MLDASSQPAKNRSPAAIKADNAIRSRLRISDPGNVDEVATALRRLFQDEDQRLTREAQGLPVVTLPALTAPVAAPGPTRAEVDQATGDVDRDLATLANDSQLKDIAPELRGWRQSINAIVADGLAAAQTALDPRARDRAFAARRQLGDYARLARMLGALTCHHNIAYRRLAQSLDEVAALLLVIMGEALARIGFGGGRFVLQAPASEIQLRRDGVIAALYNLNGAAQTSHGAKDWPYGLAGLRQALDLLDRSGHAELRALLDPNTLGRLMDDLLDRSTGSADGLRALGATAALAVQRLNRLVQVLGTGVTADSPPLTAFLSALQLFTDAYRSNSSGYRLLFVARPPAVFYGLYGIGGPDEATRRLLELIVARGRLAELLDCYLGCSCCEDPAICQILLDKVLYDTDRAIDLYLMGSDPAGQGEPERRAVAFARLIAVLVEDPELILGQKRIFNLSACLSDECLSSLGDLPGLLGEVRSTLEVAESDAANATMVLQELCLQEQGDKQLESLVASMAPSCIVGSRVFDVLAAFTKAARTRDPNIGAACPDVALDIPPTVERSLEEFSIELDS